MNDTQKKEAFMIARANSVQHAFRGVWVYLRTTPNAWVHLLSAVVLVALGMYFSISGVEWALLILANGAVLAAEAFNSAIEIDMNLTHPERHPMVRDTKDIAAGAVLITAGTAWIIALLVFVPYFL